MKVVFCFVKNYKKNNFNDNFALVEGKWGTGQERAVQPLHPLRLQPDQVIANWTKFYGHIY